jgi:hypothetical protein
MAEIEVSGSRVAALVDDEDYPLLSRYKWSLDGKGYAKTNFHIGSVNHTIKMHRLITAATKSFQVDHINQNKLDNRKDNLRLCNNRQNQGNMPKRKGGSSKYKGVHRKDGKWQARITTGSKRISLGYFLTEEGAAQAYNEAAPTYFGEFAYLNVIEEGVSV